MEARERLKREGFRPWVVLQDRADLLAPSDGCVDGSRADCGRGCLPADDVRHQPNLACETGLVRSPPPRALCLCRLRLDPPDQGANMPQLRQTGMIAGRLQGLLQT